ncbi:glycosyltransferase [Patescibacteria group bacterium]|nr:glycosyltransferase [Patescibacteria group bacterium]
MKIVIVIPCYNEEAVLEKNILQILEAVKNSPHDFRIVISDNNSKDKTGEIGKELARGNEMIDYIFVGEQGKGAAVMEAWKKYDADVYGFMDADLAVDLGALGPALESFSGGFDIAIGSRRIKSSCVKRELYRKFSSAVLNLMIRAFLKTKIKDTACGFKFLKREAIDRIVPQVRDRKWTFDTELLILAEKAGFKIKQIPVKWEEKGERSSRIVPVPTIVGYLKKIFELRRRIM